MTMMNERDPLYPDVILASDEVAAHEEDIKDFESTMADVDNSLAIISSLLRRNS